MSQSLRTFGLNRKNCVNPLILSRLPNLPSTLQSSYQTLSKFGYWRWWHVLSGPIIIIGPIILWIDKCKLNFLDQFDELWIKAVEMFYFAIIVDVSKFEFWIRSCNVNVSIFLELFTRQTVSVYSSLKTLWKFAQSNRNIFKECASKSLDWKLEKKE